MTVLSVPRERAVDPLRVALLVDVDAAARGSDTPRVRPLVDEILAGRYKTGQPIPGWDGRAAERVVAALAERYGG